MKAVILAGGLGTRLSEETDRIPKPMVEIGGLPIIWHIMKIFTQHGIRDFVVCLGYKGYVLKEFFLNYSMHVSDVTVDIRNRTTEVHQTTAEPWRITLIDTGLTTSTGGRLKRVAPHLGQETFCLTYGDGLSDVDISALVRFHASHRKLATVTAVSPPGRFGVLDLAGDSVREVREKGDSDGAFINGGFFVLEPDVISYIDGDEAVWERGCMERLAADDQLMAYRHQGYWQAMDTLREKRLLDDLWNSGEAPWKVWK